MGWVLLNKGIPTFIVEDEDSLEIQFGVSNLEHIIGAHPLVLALQRLLEVGGGRVVALDAVSKHLVLLEESLAVQLEQVVYFLDHSPPLQA